MTRSSSISMRRLALMALVVSAAFTVVAVPATAAKPAGGGNGGGSNKGTSVPTATMTIGHSEWVTNNTCAFDATYTWSGVRAKSYNLAVQLRDGTGAVLANTPQVSQVPGSGWFTFIFTFTGPARTSRNIYARGVLLSNGVEVPDTAASSPVLATTCGSPISVGWVQTIPLT